MSDTGLSDRHSKRLDSNIRAGHVRRNALPVVPRFHISQPVRPSTRPPVDLTVAIYSPTNPPGAPPSLLRNPVKVMSQIFSRSTNVRPTVAETKCADNDRRFVADSILELSRRSTHQTIHTRQSSVLVDYRTSPSNRMTSTFREQPPANIARRR